MQLKTDHGRRASRSAGGRSPRLSRFLGTSGLLLLLAAATVAKLTTTSVVVQAHSMEPTLQPSDYVLFSRLAHWFRPPARGEVVLLRAPATDSVARGESRGLVIKRIVGIPGDRILIAGGILWRNGSPVVEPYLLEPMMYNWGPVEVPADAYVVLGDNRNASDDSHTWYIRAPYSGTPTPSPFVKRRQIMGTLIYRRQHGPHSE